MSVEFRAGEPRAAGRLGTNANSVTPLRNLAAFREARRHRFARRAQSSRWLVEDAIAEHGPEHFAELAPRPATCGWAAGSVVGVHRAAAGPARFSGLQRCASVWSCACCGSLIRQTRSEEVQQAARWWEGSQGGQFLFLTLTVRHRLADPLEHTMDVLTEAFTATINGAPWKRTMRRHGIRHWIKSQEVTLGWANGWHAHLHVLIFVDLDGAARDLADDAASAWREVEDNPTRTGQPNRARLAKAQRRQDDADDAARIAQQGVSVERVRELRDWLTDRWGEMVERAGGRRPSRRRGVDVRSVLDGNVIALYVSKLQEGDRPRGWAVGQEMARQDLKKGRADSLVPLELLDVDGLNAEEVERARAYWAEYVAGTKGRRAMTWSRGLKDAAGIEDRDDDDILDAEEEATEDDDRVVIIRKEHWRVIRDDSDTLARILELVELDRAEEIARFVPFEWPPPLA